MNRMAIFVGIGIALGILLVGLLGGIWWVLTVWENEMNIAGYLNILYGFAILVGGMTAGFKASYKPWEHGAITGGIYGIFLSIISWILVPSLNQNTFLFKNLLLCICLGSLGSVVGINLQRASKRRKKQRLGMQRF